MHVEACVVCVYVKVMAQRSTLFYTQYKKAGLATLDQFKCQTEEPFMTFLFTLREQPLFFAINV